MPDHNAEEETYSLTFEALKHPIRRKILRMLTLQHLAYSEILKELSIDSGHLNYHLEKLGELIMRDVEGKYALSTIGSAAVRLMTDVEEHSIPIRKRKYDLGQIATTVYSLVLVVVLMVAGIYFIGYAVPGASISYDGRSWPGLDFWTPVTMTPDWTHEFNMTVKYDSAMDGQSFGISNITNVEAVPTKLDPNSLGAQFKANVQTFPAVISLGTSGLGTDSYTFERIPPTSTLTTREDGILRLLVATNLTSADNETATIFGQNLTVVTLLPNAPPSLSLKVFGPGGTLAYSGGIIDWNSDQRGSFGDISLTAPGTYRFEITDSGNTDLLVFFAPNVVWQAYEKPYLYYGIAALFISAIYTCMVGFGLVVSHKRMKNSRAIRS